MLYESCSGGSSFPGGRSKLSLAVAQASVRLSSKNKAPLISGGPASSMKIVNENAANHEGIVKSAPQDASTSVKQLRGVHKKKVTQTSVSVGGPQSSPKESSLLSDMQQQQQQQEVAASQIRIKAAPSPTQPQKRVKKNMLSRRKDQRHRAVTSITESSLTHDQPPVAYNQMPLLTKQSISESMSIDRHSVASIISESIPS